MHGSYDGKKEKRKKKLKLKAFIQIVLLKEHNKKNQSIITKRFSEIKITPLRPPFWFCIYPLGPRKFKLF